MLVMEIYWMTFGIVSIFYCVEAQSCTDIKDKGPFVNKTHYCVHCTYHIKHRSMFTFSAYSCGCGEWKKLYSDGCCKEPAATNDRATHCAKRPKAIFFNGSTIPLYYNNKKTVIASHKITRQVQTSTMSFDKLPLIGGCFLLLVTIVLAARVYMCVRSSRQQRRTKYEFHRVVALDVNSLQEHKV